jgi:Immunity protein 31
MPGLEFYAVVSIRPSDETRGLGIAGLTGVVVGHSGDSGGDAYAVLVDDETCMVSGSDLVPTGEVLERSAIYSGMSFSVPAEPLREEDGDVHDA